MGSAYAQSDTHWLQLTRGRVNAVSVHADFIAVGSQQGVYIYDHDFHDVAFLPVGYVYALVWNDSGTQLALTSSHDGIDQIAVWDVVTASQIQTIQSESRSGRVLAWRGDWLAATEDVSTLNDPIITIWHTETGEVIAHLPPPPQAEFPRLATSLAWHPDGDYLAIGFGDAFVWDMATMAYVYHIPAPSDGVYFDVRWHPDGRHIAAGTHGGAAHILSLDDAPIVILNLHTETPVVQIAWLDKNTLAAVTRDGFLQFWDTATGTPLMREARIFGDAGIYEMALLGDERLLLREGDVLRVVGFDGLQQAAYYGHVMNHHVAWSANGQFIISWPQATASDDAIVIVWEAQTAAIESVHHGWFDLAHPLAYRLQSHGIAWSPNARTVALTLRLLGEDRVQIWDVAQPSAPVVTLPASVDHVAWSPDGQIVATAGHQLALWSVDGDLLNETPRGAIRRFTWSPDGQYIAVDQHDAGVIIYAVPGLERVLHIDSFDFNTTERIDWAEDNLIVSSSRGAFAYSLVDGSRLEDFDYAFVAVGNRFTAGYNRHREEIDLMAQGTIVASYPFAGYVSITDLLWNPQGDAFVIIAYNGHGHYTISVHRH